MDKGLVHIYFGDGKGKTSAALGLALRASGRNKRVLVGRFLKGCSGELASLARLPGVRVLEGPERVKFTFAMSEEEKRETAALCSLLVESAKALCQDFDLLILDEAVSAVSLGFFSEDALLELITSRPHHLEMVLTGNTPSERLKELADYVSEIKKIKHPFDRGITAREGIEY